MVQDTKLPRLLHEKYIDSFSSEELDKFHFITNKITTPNKSKKV